MEIVLDGDACGVSKLPDLTRGCRVASDGERRMSSI